MKKVLFSCLLMLPLLLKAGGYQVNTQGQKVMSMGGSVSGLALDASIAFFNPAGLSYLDSNYFNVGVALRMPKTAFLGPYGGTESMSSQLYTPFYLYGNYIYNAKLSLGISVNTPFVQGTKWEENWSGRYVSQETKLNTIYVQPTASYKLSNRISLGAGPVFATSSAKWNKALNVSNQAGSDGESELEGSGNGFGFNVGLFAQFAKTSIGLAYRSEVEINLNNGEASFSNIPASLINDGTFPSNAFFETSYILPSNITVAVGHVFNEKFKGNFDLNYTGWSVCDSLVFSFKNETQLNSSVVKNYRNTFAIRVGGQYQYSERLQIRGGIAFDQSPVKDGYLSPELPDADKLILSTGCSYKLKKGWSLEASFMFEDLKERKEERNLVNNMNGTYKSYNYVLGLGIQYQF